jgi:hypothetical protein
MVQELAIAQVESVVHQVRGWECLLINNIECTCEHTGTRIEKEKKGEKEIKHAPLESLSHFP